uniref:Glycoside hydrolase family 5 domain-containing protein n=1 Tax=Acrobeloides nanus TaxID=290746 RepID=A0A914DJA6_9BILA
MWQAETFDVDLIDKELSLGPKLGMNTMRIFLHDMAYTQDPAGFKNRLNKVLSILDKYGMTAVLVFFAWGPIDNPKIGKQPQPKPSLCNSVYLRTPSWNLLQEPKNWPSLEPYVKDVVGTFANDSRVLAWDLWNEPANEPNNTNLLLPMVFDWARSVNPIQPLTTPLWKNAYVGTDNYSPIEQLQINNSDVVSFHKQDGSPYLLEEAQITKRLNGMCV